MDNNTYIGLKVLAALHAGLITWNCSGCETDPDRKIQLACDEESSNLIWKHPDIGEFYSCPLKWITMVVLDWYDEYLYLKEFPGVAPKYGEFNKLFWDACKIYTGAYSKYQIEAMKDKSTGKGDKTSQSLSNLKQGFKGRKK